MNVPCLREIIESFKSEVYNMDYGWFKKNGCDPQLQVFPQIWGSTALGFGGIGGQAMTSAYTTVVEDIYSGYYGVFFGNRLAYIIKNPNQTFFEDVNKHSMKDILSKKSYVRKEAEK